MRKFLNLKEAVHALQVSLIVWSVFFLFMFLLCGHAKADPIIPEFHKMSGPPIVVTNEDDSMSVVIQFDGLRFKYKMTGDQKPKPYPQCNIIQKVGDELQVMQSRPTGMIFFITSRPYEFMTEHNKKWVRIIYPTSNGIKNYKRPNLSSNFFPYQ